MSLPKREPIEGGQNHGASNGLNLGDLPFDVLHAELLKRQQNEQRRQFQQHQPQQPQQTLPQQQIWSQPQPVLPQLVQMAEPSVLVIEQPKARGLRFRYKCEGRSAGSIPGEGSTNERKTYPTIQINNFSGPAAIVVASCVTKDKPYQPHPHNLVGQDCKDGVCTIKVKGNNIVSFPNIGIQCCKRHDVEESLKLREKIRVDPYATGFYNNLPNLDLNTVRLCFQVFLPDTNKKFTHIVPPVASQPIIDKKSIHDLVICRLSKQSGYANGGDEVFLLCEKINKDDIQVRFYQETEDGVSWEAFGEFAAHDVHRQFAIVFRTPPFKDVDIQAPVQVLIQLRRPSDDEVGDPKPFQYIPQDRDPYGLEMKRKRKEVTLASYRDRIPIPTTVLQEIKDEPETASQDIKLRLKKRVERSQMGPNFASSASVSSAMERDTFGVGSMALGGPGVMTLPHGGMSVGPGRGAATNYPAFFGDSASDADIVAAAMREFNVGDQRGGGGGANDYTTVTALPGISQAMTVGLEVDSMFSAAGAIGVDGGGAMMDGSGTTMSGVSDSENQLIMQFLHDHPNALVSGDQFTLSGLSEFNISGSGMEQLVSTDMNVGAQESVLLGGAGGAAGAGGGGEDARSHPLHNF